MEREDFERIKKLESLQMQAENELAQARSKAALTDREAQLAQQMEEVENSHGLTLQDTDATTHDHESWQLLHQTLDTHTNKHSPATDADPKREAT